jgi:hypothetical protein
MKPTDLAPWEQDGLKAKNFRDNWMQTFTGRPFYPFKPRESEIVIEDIAHHLSMICRFTGAVREHYSVGQHSILVSQLVPDELALDGLMHDASEAYTNDMGSPQKAGLPDFRAVEDDIQQAICERFDLQWPMPPEVKRADQIAVACEAHDLMANAPTLWKLPRKPIIGARVVPLQPKEVEQLFLERFRELMASRRPVLIDTTNGVRKCQ